MSNKNNLNQKEINIFTEFKEIKGLGANCDILLIVKSLTEAKDVARRLDKKRQSEVKGVYYPHFPVRSIKKDEGFVAIGKLANISLKKQDRYSWIYPGRSKFAFALNNTYVLIGFIDEIRVFSTKTGEYIKTISNLKLSRVHSLEFSRDNPNTVLCTSMGTNKILEFDVESNQVTWEWNPLLSGYNRNRHGIYIYPSDKYLSETSNKLKIVDSEYITWLTNKGIIAFNHYTNLANALQAQDGAHSNEVENWQNTFKPSWAGYDPREDDTILATSHSLGIALHINKKGKSKVITKDLLNPHGVIPTSTGYVITNTGKGRVVLLNSKKEITNVYDFTDLPFDSSLKSRKHEWLQYTYPLTDDLLVTIDSKRSHIVVWNNQSRYYSIYQYNPNWLLQSVSGYFGKLPPHINKINMKT